MPTGVNASTDQQPLALWRRRGARAWTLRDTMSSAPHVAPTAAVHGRHCQCAAWVPVTKSCWVRFVCGVLVGSGCR